jgi:ankyrin repeat protein
MSLHSQTYIRISFINKADPNICCEEKSSLSPLCNASHHGYTEIVELLLNNKANPNICCEEKSPLYVASKNCYFEIVKLLLKSGNILGSALLFNSNSTISV